MARLRYGSDIIYQTNAAQNLCLTNQNAWKAHALYGMSLRMSVNDVPLGVSYSASSATVNTL